MRVSKSTLVSLLTKAIVPGLALTRAFQELAEKQLVSGASQALFAVLQLLSLAYGIIVAAVFWGFFYTVEEYENTPLFQALFPAFMAAGTIGFAINLQVPPKHVCSNIQSNLVINLFLVVDCIYNCKWCWSYQFVGYAARGKAFRAFVWWCGDYCDIQSVFQALLPTFCGDAYNMWYYNVSSRWLWTTRDVQVRHPG